MNPNLKYDIAIVFFLLMSYNKRKNFDDIIFMFVGQPDVDCLNDALCCFDGCANVCQGAGPIQQPAQPPTPVRPAQGIDRWIVFQVA